MREKGIPDSNIFTDRQSGKDFSLGKAERMDYISLGKTDKLSYNLLLNRTFLFKLFLSNADYAIPEAYVFHNGNVSTAEKVTYLPVYMLMFVEHKNG